MSCVVHPGPPRDGWLPLDLSLFNMAVYSKLRGCDLVALWKGSLCCRRVKERTSMIHSETGKPVWFWITETSH